MKFVIEYDSRSTVNGEPVGTVFVRRISDAIPGYPVGTGSFTYTKDPLEASVWDSEVEADRELRRRHWHNARVRSLEEVTS